MNINFIDGPNQGRDEYIPSAIQVGVKIRVPIIGFGPTLLFKVYKVFFISEEMQLALATYEGEQDQRTAWEEESEKAREALHHGLQPSRMLC